MGWRDDWPTMPNGNKYDGKQLSTLLRNDDSPFREVWDVNLLIREIEENTKFQVVNIPIVEKGSNNYGFHIQTSNGPDIVARLARGDVNMPDFDGFSVEQQVSEVEFEAVIYNLLRTEPDIRAARLLYHRVPIQYPGLRLLVPHDISGRRLFVFERAAGMNNVWGALNNVQKLRLLDQLAHMRAALFHYTLPVGFAARYLVCRLFDFMPKSFSITVEPTREFWMRVIEAKIKATIRNLGDEIGWEDDNEKVGPIALAAKELLLRVIPYIMPLENAEGSLYRLVLEHGDFGIHNTSIMRDTNGEPLVTSLYDWETACIAPAILSDPLVAAGPVDLTTEDGGNPSVTRTPKNVNPSDMNAYTTWAQHYISKLYTEAPDYAVAIKAGKDVRYLWFALRDWRGGDSEIFFANLSEWAENKIRGTYQL